VIALTAGLEIALYRQYECRCFMAASGWPLTRFERALLWAALVLAGLLVAARLGAVVILTILHHGR
jgi:hypothetical protein